MVSLYRVLNEIDKQVYVHQKAHNGNPPQVIIMSQSLLNELKAMNKRWMPTEESTIVKFMNMHVIVGDFLQPSEFILGNKFEGDVLPC